MAASMAVQRIRSAKSRRALIGGEAEILINFREGFCCGSSDCRGELEHRQYQYSLHDKRVGSLRERVAPMKMVLSELNPDTGASPH